MFPKFSGSITFNCDIKPQTKGREPNQQTKGTVLLVCKAPMLQMVLSEVVTHKKHVDFFALDIRWNSSDKWWKLFRICLERWD